MRRRAQAANAALDVSLYSDDERVSLSQNAIRFEAGETEKTVVAHVADDNVVDGPREFQVTALANEFLTGHGVVAIDDNDEANLIWSLPSAPVTARQLAEGIQFSATLTARPTKDVRVELVSPPGYAFEPAIISITPDHWNNGELVKVRLLPGNLVPGGPSSLDPSITLTSEDSNFTAAMVNPLVIKAVNATPMQNPFNRFDVNGDTNDTALDALIIINALNPDVPLGVPLFNRMLDVSGDNLVSSLDALQAINNLAKTRAEKEQVVAIPLTGFLPQEPLFPSDHTGIPAQDLEDRWRGCGRSSAVHLDAD